MAKYCANCNNLLNDDQIRFCPTCGSSQFIPAQPVEPSAPAQPAQQAYYVQPAAPVEPAAPQSAPVMPQFDTIPDGKPKKKISIKKIAFIAIPIILVVAILLNMSSIIGLATKLFGSDESYFAYVEKQAVSKSVDTFSEFYQNYLLDDLLKDNSYNVKFSVKLSDDLKETVKGDYAKQLDIDWLDDTTFDMTLNVGDKKISEDLLIGIGSQHVLTTSAVFDLKSNKALLKLKEITDDVLVFNLDSATGALEGLESDGREVAAAILPEVSVAKDLITKYHGIIVDKIENVEKSKEEVKIEGISEELTVLKAEITEKTLKDISLAVLSEMKGDSTVKNIIENAEKTLSKNGLADKNEISYAQFTSDIDEAVAEIKAEKGSDDIALTVYDYVNSKDEIVGRKIGDNGEMLDYVTVENGNKYASRSNFEGSIECIGTGTKNGDRETGEYTFREDGNVIYKIALTDFDKKAFENGKIDGKIRLYPSSKSVKSAVPSDYKSLAGMLDVAMEIDGKGDSKTGKFKLTSYNGEKTLFTADAQYSVSASKAVSEPSGKKVEIKGLNSLQALLGDLHLDQLVKNLRKTSVPKDYVDAIDEVAKQLKQ